MGFYFQCERRRGLTDDLSPTITPGEYVSTLSSVIRTLAGSPSPRCQRHQVRLRYLAVASPQSVAHIFSDVIQREPNNQPAHRLLGIAHLSQGNLTAAVKHLEIALGLLRREARGRAGLYDTLRIQCERALLRLLLVPLYMKLGQVVAARSLLIEGQVL